MHKVIVIAASAGGLQPLRQIVAALPEACPAAIFVVVHIGNHRSDLPTILSWSSKLKASFATDDLPIQAGHIYVAPPDQHMVLESGRIRLNRGPKVHHTRPAADPLFISAAKVYGDRVIGVVLSGGDGDGAEGLRVIKEHGGRAVVQKPEEAVDPAMPEVAIATDHPDACLSAGEIAKLMELCGEPSG
ncbi:chemotaxis protein CheB [Methylocystis sp. JR02]|uniref:chemotaxis protein CheB n=1 Tax=Methylocystis sp. JR02 TaxID=3046284 RepID=UPI0024BB1528|nr:chemotaxis protein CheB [Methylocystis sp. JR02]MDJ0449174.1 chemotaxis protein CheB [Methylocystis sp. JR02]